MIAELTSLDTRSAVVRTLQYGAWTMVQLVFLLVLSGEAFNPALIRALSSFVVYMFSDILLNHTYANLLYLSWSILAVL